MSNEIPTFERDVYQDPLIGYFEKDLAENQVVKSVGCDQRIQNIWNKSGKLNEDRNLSVRSPQPLARVSDESDLNNTDPTIASSKAFVDKLMKDDRLKGEIFKAIANDPDSIPEVAEKHGFTLSSVGLGIALQGVQNSGNLSAWNGVYHFDDVARSKRESVMYVKGQEQTVSFGAINSPKPTNNVTMLSPNLLKFTQDNLMYLLQFAQHMDSDGENLPNTFKATAYDSAFLTYLQKHGSIKDGKIAYIDGGVLKQWTVESDTESAAGDKRTLRVVDGSRTRRVIEARHFRVNGHLNQGIYIDDTEKDPNNPIYIVLGDFNGKEVKFTEWYSKGAVVGSATIATLLGAGLTAIIQFCYKKYKKSKQQREELRLRQDISEQNPRSEEGAREIDRLTIELDRARADIQDLQKVLENTHRAANLFIEHHEEVYSSSLEDSLSELSDEEKKEIEENSFKNIEDARRSFSRDNPNQHLSPEKLKETANWTFLDGIEDATGKASLNEMREDLSPVSQNVDRITAEYLEKSQSKTYREAVSSTVDYATAAHHEQNSSEALEDAMINILTLEKTQKQIEEKIKAKDKELNPEEEEKFDDEEVKQLEKELEELKEESRKHQEKIAEANKEKERLEKEHERAEKEKHEAFEREHSAKERFKKDHVR